jgi:Uma2 family endonuclease
MATPRTKVFENRRFTVEEYLAYERASETRHEYLDGDIRAMAGESNAHGEICANVFGELYIQLKNSPCRLRAKDTKVLTGFASLKKKKGLFSYPDIIVICGEPQFMDEHHDILLNPKVIIEVLSDSTAGFDKEGKFIRYQKWLPTLTNYILIEQDAPFVLHYRRLDADRWEAHGISGLEKTLELVSLDCRLPLVDIYNRIEFPPSVEDDTDESETAETEP